MKQINKKLRLWILFLFAGVFLLGVTTFTAKAAACSHSYSNGFCSKCDGYQAASDSNGDGVVEIGNAGELYWFAQQVGSGNADIDAILTADIDINPGYTFQFEEETGLVRVEKDSSLIGYLGTGKKGTTSFREAASQTGTVYNTSLSPVTSGNVYNKIQAIRLWVPIGNSGNSYTGSFDGKNHTVSGLYVNTTSTDYTGLFGGVYSGVVSDTAVLNSCVLGRKNTGGIVGYSSMSSVSDCSFAGTISGASHVGGIAGYAYASDITRCSSTGAVVASDYIAGGIAGEIAEYSGISNSYHIGAVSGGREKIGGIVGYHYGGSSVTSCYHIGTVTGEHLVGGVVGSSAASTVADCFYLADSETDSIDGTTCQTAEAFASGQVAYALQQNLSTPIWGQNLDNGEPVQKSPTLSNAAVYACYECDGKTLSYTNASGETTKPHIWDENGVCASCGSKLVKSWNITLADSIGINFVVNLTEKKSVTCYIGQTQLDAVVTDNADGTSTVSVCLAAAQMTDEITLSINGKLLKKSYSVREYADVILAGEYNDSTKNLVKHMLHYGGNSQLYFQYNENSLANTGIEIAEVTVHQEGTTVTQEGGVSGIRFYGASLVYQSKTAVRFYFSAVSMEGITFKVNDVEYLPVAKNGLYYVEVGNILPQDVDAEILVQVSDGTNSLCVGYAPLTYIIRMYSKADSSEGLKDLVQALYGYHIAAKAYAEQEVSK